MTPTKMVGRDVRRMLSLMLVPRQPAEQDTCRLDLHKHTLARKVIREYVI